MTRTYTFVYSLYMATTKKGARTVIVAMRVTPAEKLRIGKAAAAGYQTDSSFCRRIVLEALDREEEENGSE